MPTTYLPLELSSQMGWERRSGASRSVVLDWVGFATQGYVWQHPKTLWLSQMGICYYIWWVETKDSAKRSKMHWIVAQQKIIPPKMSINSAKVERPCSRSLSMKIRIEVIKRELYASSIRFSLLSMKCQLMSHWGYQWTIWVYTLRGNMPWGSWR